MRQNSAPQANFCIGTSPNGKDLYTIKVVINEFGDVLLRFQ